MTPSSSFLRVSRLSLAGICVSFLGACAGQRTTVATAPAPASVPSSGASERVAVPAPSVFDLKDYWYSQHVPAALFSSMQGGLLVVGFVDTLCTSACETTLKSMQALERETDYKVHFLVVSAAEERGNSTTLAAFAKAHHLRPARYTVISSNSAAVSDLVAVLDQGYGKLTLAGLQGSSVLSVLDYNGINVRQRGNGVIDALLESLTLLENMR